VRCSTILPLFLGHVLEGTHDVGDEPSLLVRRHQAEQVSGLDVVVVDAPILLVPVGDTRDLQWGLGVSGIRSRATKCVRLIVDAGARVAVEPRKAVPLSVVRFHLGAVDREKPVVRSQSLYR